MAQKVYVLSLHVVESKLGAVISALQGEATIISVAPTKESSDATPMTRVVPSRATHYVGGKRQKGISGKDLIMKILDSENKAFLISEIVKKFVEHGFAETSAYPVTYEAVKLKKAMALGDGRYQSAKWPLRTMGDIGAATSN